ncbi:MAG: alpha/beta hydrolase [Chitinophagaceae bacterium]
MKFLRRIFRILLFLFLLLNMVAAFHAYKFTHFYPNSEIVKKKPEDMNWWDKTSAILFGIHYGKSLNAIKPDTVFTTINLKTNTGLRIEGWYMQHPMAKGTILLFHGHGSSKSKLLNEADYMFSLGFNTLLIDFRAHGGSDGEICTIGYHEAEEIKLAYDYVQSRGEKSIYLWGISMGAAAITHAMNEYNLKPKKIILEMPFGSLQDAVKGRVRIMGLPEQPISTLLTFWGGTEQGFWAFNHNPSDYAKKITCPVLLQWGALDARVTKRETLEIYNQIASTDKKLVIYETATHESLCNKEIQQWRKEISSFLLK